MKISPGVYYVPPHDVLVIIYRHREVTMIDKNTMHMVQEWVSDIDLGQGRVNGVIVTGAEHLIRIGEL